MRIIKSLQKLDLYYIPGKIPCREREFERLKMLMMSGGKALISGDTGTGKTLLAKFFDRNSAYVNCFVNRSEHAVLESILSKLRPNFNPAGLPSRRLWDEIPNNSLIVLDEIEGLSVDDLSHFLYTLSRRGECGRKLKYIAITKDADILKEMVGDDAVWSTFAGKSIVFLEKYRRDDMIKILNFRVSEALHSGTYDEEIIKLIADISLRSEGHMRTGIELLRNSALIAENDGRDHIEPEDVRKANLDTWINDINILDDEHLLLLLSIARCCKKKGYVSLDDIKSSFNVTIENYSIKPIKNLETLLRELEANGFIVKEKEGYTLIFSSEDLIRKIERVIEKYTLS